MSSLRLLLDAVLDFLYRIDCVCCGKRREVHCRDLQQLYGICPSSGIQVLIVRKTHFEEFSREHSEPSGNKMYGMQVSQSHYDQALAVFEYSITKRVIHRYKYDGEYRLGRTFASLYQSFLRNLVGIST